MTINKLFNSIEQSLEIINEPLTEEQKDFIFSILETFFKRYEESILNNLKDKIPLYTHPTTWQSLSDDEIVGKWNENFVGNTFKGIEFARAIEQALKELNAKK